MKKILLLLTLIASSYSFAADDLVDIEAKKAKIQNAFDSVSLDIQQDALCLEKVTDCMDEICNNSKTGRCICASYFENTIMPKRSKLLKMQEETEKIINTDIPKLKTQKATLKQAGAWGDDDEEFEMTYSAITINTAGKTGDFLEKGTSLYTKAKNACEKIAKSCSSTNATKILESYKSRINDTCNDYLDHLNKEEETIAYDNMQAKKMKKSYKDLAIGGSYNILTCSNKLKEFYVRECSGFDYKNCIKCTSVNSEDTCKKEVQKNFQDRKTRVFAEIGQKCGKENFELAFQDLLTSVNGNFSATLRTVQKLSDDMEDADIKEYTDKIVTCVAEICDLNWSNCSFQSEIDNIIQTQCVRETNQMNTRFANKPEIIESIQAKVQIEINKRAKLRGKDLNKQSSSTQNLYD